MWKDGNILLVSSRTDNSLPESCIKCNNPECQYRLKKTYYWHRPMLLLLIPMNLVLYLIVAACCRKRAIVHFSLCQQHYKERQARIVQSCFMLPLGLILILFSFFSSVIFQVSDTIAAGILIVSIFCVGAALFLVGLNVFLKHFNVISPTKINDSLAWFKGVDKEILAPLPELIERLRLE